MRYEVFFRHKETQPGTNIPLSDFSVIVGAETQGDAVLAATSQLLHNPETAAEYKITVK